MNKENYKYQLDKSSKKFHCPECNKKRFVRYINLETREYLSSEFGRCDRQINCGYHLKPNFNELHSIGKNKIVQPQPPKAAIKEFIPIEEMSEMLNSYGNNAFIQNLGLHVPFPFDAKDIEKVISLYYIGTAPNGATCFPFINKEGKICAIQEKIFNRDNHTDKSRKYHTSWTHSRLENTKYRNKPLPEWLERYKKNETKVSCLFGEHLLLKYPRNPIALVEAPKTAIYGALYFGFPEDKKNFLWLSTYSLSGISYDKCKSLEGRKVFLFPDLSKKGSAFELWSEKAQILEKSIKGASFKVSQLLEQLATKEDRESGKDLADYLIKQDWRQFSKMPQMPQMPRGNNSEEKQAKNLDFEFEDVDWGEFLPTNEPEPLKWDDVIKELESYFSKINLPTEPIQLNQCSKVLDSSLFVENHLNTVKRYNGNYNFEPYLIRLQQLKEILIN